MAWKGASSFSSIALIQSWMTNLEPRLDLVTPDGADRLRGAFVTPNFFDLLGVRPALGRTFSAGDEAAGQRVALISDALWRRRFGADPAVIGRPVDLVGARTGRQPYTVIGVLPPAFRFTYPRETEAWAILAVAHDQAAPGARIPDGRKTHTRGDRGTSPSRTGLAVGLLGSWSASRLVGRFLFEVSPLDPLANATSALTLSLAAAVASYVSARPLHRVEAMTILKAE